MPPIRTDETQLHEVLITELHHRFYNSLQVLSSMANSLTRENLPTDAIRQTVTSLQRRIDIIGNLHRLLAEQHGADLGHSCASLCRTLAAAFDREDACLRLSVPPGTVDPSVGRGMMLMLAELVTNAMKHTPLQHPLSIDVTIVICDSEYELTVASCGQGRSVHGPTPPRVASQLADRFGGSLSIEVGARYVVQVRVPVR